jgi:RNA polymerase sigma-70 factor (ECF subfamily)
MDHRDPEAFREAYRAHRPTIRRYFAARAPLDRADDLTAETFLIAWRRAGEGRAGTLPWLLNVAAKVLANDRRKVESSQELFGRLVQVSPLTADSSATQAATRADHLAVLRALAELRPADREVLLLTLWDGLSTGEVAVATGVTPIAARARISRARRRLQTALRAELIGPPPHPSQPITGRTTT